MPGAIMLLTLTAPGVGAHYLPSGDRCECSLNPRPLGEWNAGCGQAWTWLMTYLRRRYSPSIEFFKATEVQARGALHFHVLLRLPKASAARLQADYRRRDPACPLRALVISRGFGHEVDLERLDTSPEGLSKASNYVAKYVAKAVDQRHEVPWTVGRVEGPTEGRARYRPWSSSRGWGVTMKELRAAQVVWMRRSSTPPEPLTERTSASVRPLDPNTSRYTLTEAVELARARGPEG